MNLEQIRQDLVGAVNDLKAGFTGGYPILIEYDNILVVDTQTQTDPFLQVEVKIIDMEQVEMSDNPLHRVRGQLVLAAAVKEGTGTKQANILLDYFYTRLHRKSLGCVRTHMATTSPKVTHLGWLYIPVIVPFWADLKYTL